jgi:hypothetical protein
MKTNFFIVCICLALDPWMLAMDPDPSNIEGFISDDDGDSAWDPSESLKEAITANDSQGFATMWNLQRYFAEPFSDEDWHTFVELALTQQRFEICNFLLRLKPQEEWVDLYREQYEALWSTQGVEAPASQEETKDEPEEIVDEEGRPIVIDSARKCVSFKPEALKELLKKQKMLLCHNSDNLEAWEEVFQVWLHLIADRTQGGESAFSENLFTQVLLLAQGLASKNAVWFLTHIQSFDVRKKWLAILGLPDAEDYPKDEIQSCGGFSIWIFLKVLGFEGMNAAVNFNMCWEQLMNDMGFPLPIIEEDGLPRATTSFLDCVFHPPHNLLVWAVNRYDVKLLQYFWEHRDDLGIVLGARNFQHLWNAVVASNDPSLLYYVIQILSVIPEGYPIYLTRLEIFPNLGSLDFLSLMRFLIEQGNLLWLKHLFGYWEHHFQGTDLEWSMYLKELLNLAIQEEQPLIFGFLWGEMPDESSEEPDIIEMEIRLPQNQTHATPWIQRIGSLPEVFIEERPRVIARSRSF